MNTKNHWVLPQGIEEALPEQAERLETLRRDLLDLYSCWGYELVMPPFIDHIESLITGTGRDLDIQTFKLVDQISGRTLGIRADMTPQVARIDAAQLDRDVATRLCYIGTVLRTQPDSFGSTRSPLQVGAELYGHAGAESEVEIISLMLKTFSTVGIDDVYVDLGNVDIFRSLAKQAGLTADTESQLFEMLQRKAVTEINELLSPLSIDENAKQMFACLVDLNGGREVLDAARTKLSAGGENVKRALDYLEKTADLVVSRNKGVQLHFDLAELHGYHYKTGVVFAAFVPESGQAIARGGRYDDIGELFGRARAATGFSTDLKTLNALSKRVFTKQARVLAPYGEDQQLSDAIENLRDSGVQVVEQMPEENSSASEMNCQKELRLIDGEWSVVDIDSQ